MSFGYNSQPYVVHCKDMLEVRCVLSALLTYVVWRFTNLILTLTFRYNMLFQVYGSEEVVSDLVCSRRALPLAPPQERTEQVLPDVVGEQNATKRAESRDK